MEHLSESVLNSFRNNLQLNPHEPNMALSTGNTNHQYRFALVGRTLLPTGRGRDALIEAINNRWRHLRRVQIVPVTRELFIFNFPEHEEDLLHVLRQQPWSVYGQVLLLHRFRPGSPPQEVPLNSFDIWFYFEDLPYLHWSEEGIVDILQNVTPVREIQPHFGFPTTSLGYRVRTTILSSAPLPQSVNVIDEYGSLRQINLRYERLPPYYCTYCYHMGHRHASCTYRMRDIDHQQSSVGEDDPDIAVNYQAADAYLNLTAEGDASQTHNQIPNDINSTSS